MEKKKQLIEQVKVVLTHLKTITLIKLIVVHYK